MRFIKKRKVPTAIFIGFCAVAAFICFGCLCLPSNDISLGGRGIALGIMLAFVVLLVWGVLEWRNKQAGIAISHEGFLDQSTLLACGFVPWNNVKTIIIISNGGHCYASFVLHDSKQFLDQAPRQFIRFVNSIFFLIDHPIRLNMNGYHITAQEIASLLESTYGQRWTAKTGQWNKL